MGAIDKPQPDMHPARLPRPPPRRPAACASLQKKRKQARKKRAKAKATMARQGAALRPRGRIRGAKARNHKKPRSNQKKSGERGQCAPARLGRGCARQGALQRTERYARSMKAKNRRNGGKGGEKRAATRDALEREKTGRSQPIRPRRRHISLPPTTKPLETFKVGWPTPTGTDWPFLPHTPIPSSS